MNITQEKIDNLNSVVKVSIKPEDYRERVEKAIKTQAKKAKLPGFRPGMVPATHIKRMYGKSILVDEINNLLNDSLNKYIEENKLEVLGQPLPKIDENKEFKWDYNEEFEFDYELGLAPEFELNFSADDKLPYYQIKIDDETLEERIQNIRKSYGKMTNPEVAAEDDILYSELVQLSPDGSVFEGGIHTTASVRIDLIEDADIKKSLIGLKKDDVIDLDVQKAFKGDTFQISKLLNISEDDAKDLKSAFRLTVKNVNRLDAADLDQEFFDKLFGAGQVTTEEQFREKIKSELESMMAQNAEQKLHNEMVTFGLSKFNLQLPDEFLKRWLKTTNGNITDEELEKGYDDFARNLKWTIIENKLIKENNIEIKYEDVFETAKQRLDAQFKMYSPQTLPDEQLSQYAVQFLQNKENANKIFEEVKTLKVLDFLKTVITLEKQDIEYKKFLELN